MPPAPPSGQLVQALQPHTHIYLPGTRVEVSADPGHDLACFYRGKAVPMVAHSPSLN